MEGGVVIQVWGNPNAKKMAGVRRGAEGWRFFGEPTDGHDK